MKRKLLIVSLLVIAMALTLTSCAEVSAGPIPLEYTGQWTSNSIARTLSIGTSVIRVHDGYNSYSFEDFIAYVMGTGWKGVSTTYRASSGQLTATVSLSHTNGSTGTVSVIFSKPSGNQMTVYTTGIEGFGTIIYTKPN